MSAVNRVFLSAVPFDHTQLCHVLPQPRMLKLIVGKGHQVYKLSYACRSWMQLLLAIALVHAHGVCVLESSSL